MLLSFLLLLFLIVMMVFFMFFDWVLFVDFDIFMVKIERKRWVLGGEHLVRFLGGIVGVKPGVLVVVEMGWWRPRRRPTSP